MAAGLTWTNLAVTVATAGTAVQVQEAAEDARMVVFQADDGNGAAVTFVGLSNVSSTVYMDRMTVNQTAFLPQFPLWGPAGTVDISQYWIDADTNGAIVHVSWI